MGVFALFSLVFIFVAAMATGMVPPSDLAAQTDAPVVQGSVVHMSPASDVSPVQAVTPVASSSTAVASAAQSGTVSTSAGRAQENTIISGGPSPVSLAPAAAMAARTNDDVQQGAHCTDTDGGLNYSYAGKVFSDLGVFEDSCISLSVLNETYCDAGNNTAFEAYPCPQGSLCVIGQCLPSYTMHLEKGENALTLPLKPVSPESIIMNPDYGMEVFIMRPPGLYATSVFDDIDHAWLPSAPALMQYSSFVVRHYKPLNLTFVGREFTETQTLNLSSGYNLVGIPYCAGGYRYNASGIVGELASLGKDCNSVVSKENLAGAEHVMWYSTNASYVPYGVSKEKSDFAISGTSAYWLACNMQGSYAWTPACSGTYLPYRNISITNIMPTNPEFVEISNLGNVEQDMGNWTIEDGLPASSGHVYTFHNFTLGAGNSVRLYTDAGNNTQSELFWGRSCTKGGSCIWNNDKDNATLRDAGGNAVSFFSY